MTLLVGLAVDLGGQVHAKQRAEDIAAEAARAGGQQLQAGTAIRGQGAVVDPGVAANAARTYLAGADGVTGSVSVAGTRVVVDTQTSYTTQFLSIIGIRTLAVTGHAEAATTRAVAGAPR